MQVVRQEIFTIKYEAYTAPILSMYFPLLFVPKALCL